MKHQKEWHTCDRCGTEISENDTDVHNGTAIFAIRGFFEKTKMYDDSDITSYDLCPKCRKDFERFMRNE